MSATADFYISRADQSARDARTTDLPNVRERCLRAEAAWRAMADRLDPSRRSHQRPHNIARRMPSRPAEVPIGR